MFLRGGEVTSSSGGLLPHMKPPQMLVMPVVWFRSRAPGGTHSFGA